MCLHPKPFLKFYNLLNHLLMIECFFNLFELFNVVKNLVYMQLCMLCWLRICYTIQVFAGFTFVYLIMEEFWRQCVRWLIDTGVLPRQHKTSFPHAQIFDLAQTLRDGVVLCNLLNVLRPGSVDLSRINIRPQMLQVCAWKNVLKLRDF